MPHPFAKAREKGIGRSILLGLSGPSGLAEAIAEHKQRPILQQLIEQQKQDSQLKGHMEDLWAQATNTMTAKEMQAYGGALQAKASDIYDINSVFSGFQKMQKHLRQNIVTSNDAEQLDVMNSQMDLARRYMLSDNPKLQQEGTVLMGKVLDAQQAYATTNEAQRIQADQLRTTQGIAGANLRYNQDMSLSQDMRQHVITPFMQTEESYNKAVKLLNSPDRLGYDFAFTMAIQSLDGSVVREGERMSYTGANGLVAQATDTFNRWKGERTPENEKALRDAIAAIHSANIWTVVRAIDTYAQQTAAYGGDWKRVGSVVPPELSVYRQLRDKGINQDQFLDPILNDNIAAQTEQQSTTTATDSLLGIAAIGKTAWDAIPTTAKAILGAAGLLKSGAIMKKVLPMLASIPGLLVSVPLLSTFIIEHSLQRKPGETDEEYNKRLDMIQGGLSMGVPVPHLPKKRDTDEYPQ